MSVLNMIYSNLIAQSVVRLRFVLLSVAGTATRRPPCEGLWVFPPLRLKDFGALTAFVWKKNVSVLRV